MIDRKYSTFVWYYEAKTINVKGRVLYHSREHDLDLHLAFRASLSN